jgi:hypothetical protein
MGMYVSLFKFFRAFLLNHTSYSLLVSRLVLLRKFHIVSIFGLLTGQFGGYKTSLVGWACVSALFLIFYCEYAIYYVVLFQVSLIDAFYFATNCKLNSILFAKCSWPELSEANEDKKITINNIEEPVKAMFIADTHLLGTRRGHWFDKLRR